MSAQPGCGQFVEKKMFSLNLDNYIYIGSIPRKTSLNSSPASLLNGSVQAIQQPYTNWMYSLFRTSSQSPITAGYWQLYISQSFAPMKPSVF